MLGFLDEARELFDGDIEIVGDGEREAIVLESTIELAVAVEGCKVTLENVMIRLLESKARSGTAVSLLKFGRRIMRAVGITVGEDVAAAAFEAAAQEGILRVAAMAIRGELHLRRCDIDARSGVGVSAGLEGSVRVESCQIHGASIGVLVGPGGRVLVEQSEDFGNNRGILATTGSDLTVRGSSVRNADKDGIRIRGDAAALIEKSDISLVHHAAIHVEAGARPVIRTSRIHHAENGTAGVWVDASFEGGQRHLHEREDGAAGHPVARCGAPRPPS